MRLGYRAYVCGTESFVFGSVVASPDSFYLISRNFSLSAFDLLTSRNIFSLSFSLVVLVFTCIGTAVFAGLGKNIGGVLGVLIGGGLGIGLGVTMDAFIKHLKPPKILKILNNLKPMAYDALPVNVIQHPNWPIKDQTNSKVIVIPYSKVRSAKLSWWNDLTIKLDGCTLNFEVRRFNPSLKAAREFLKQNGLKVS